MAHSSNSAAHAVTAFSLFPYWGIAEGIRVWVDVATTKNDGSKHAPHVKCGERFVTLDRMFPPAIEFDDDLPVIRNADAFSVSRDNAPSFYVLRGSRSSVLLLYVDTAIAVNDKVKLFVDPGVVNAWRGVKFDGGVEAVCSDSFIGHSLLRFSKSGQTADVYLQNGDVVRVRRQGDEFVTVKVDPKEIAELRVNQFREQINKLDSTPEDIRRQHGILAGAYRLLSAADKHGEARDVLVKFLREFTDGGMPEKLQLSIRQTLINMGDMSAAYFIIGDNVTEITSARKGIPADRKAKLADRRSRDQRRTAQTHNGGLKTSKKQ